MKSKEETQSVRISKEIVQRVKINAAQFGGTIKSILEEGADFGIGKQISRWKKKKK